MTATRRDLLRLAAATAVIAACERALPGPSPSPSATPSSIATGTPPPTPSATATPVVRTLLVRAAALADGVTPAAVRDAVVLVRGERIAYAGARDGAPDGGGAEVVDLPGATLVPAMVDAHVHLTGTGGANAHARLQDPDDVLVARAIENARLVARGGVLAVRDVGALRGTNLRARDMLRGAMDAPLIAASGTWIARRGRYVPFAIEVDTVEQLVATALAHLDAGADLVKVAVDGATQSGATFTAAELRQVVEAVHARGRQVAAHSQGFGARVAAEAGVDTIEHGFSVDAGTARVMAGRVTLVTSLGVARAFGQLEIAAPAIRAARDAGVRIAVGTDAGGGPPQFGSFAAEVELLVGAGLTPQAALASATRAGGAVMRVAGLGTLDAGAPADFVAVDGDPLADPAALRHVRAVFRAGRRIV